MEEKDETDVAENWEEADAEDLERRMELRQMHTKGEQRGSSSSSSACSASVPPSSQTPLRVSEWEGTQYVAPVKILRRSTETETEALSTGKSTVDTACTSNQHKTFAQREAEYASARARILGSKSNDRAPS